MSYSFQSQQPLHRVNWRRALLLCAGLVLLLSGGIPLFLNALGIISISSAWVNVLEAFLAVLGSVIAIGQWAFPTLGQPSGGGQDVGRRGKRAFCKRVKRGLDRFFGKAVLVVFAEDHEVAREVSLVDRRSWNQGLSSTQVQLISIRTELVRSYRFRIGWFHTGYVRAALFRDLDPGDYVAWFDVNQPFFVAVFPNDVAVVDRSGVTV